MKNFRLSFVIMIVANAIGITKLYSSADDRNFREAQRAYYGKIHQAYEELCKLNPSQEKIEEFKTRNNPIIDAALVKYQIEKLLSSSESKGIRSVPSVQSSHRDSQGWYPENTFESDK
jgi:hypothetical protein